MSAESERAPCTPLSARWCAVHGRCICERSSMCADNCPLHSANSTHGVQDP